MFAGGSARFRQDRHTYQMVSLHIHHGSMDVVEGLVLCSIDKETPPENVKENKEHRGVQARGVSRIKKLSSQRAKENDAGGAADGADEHVQPATEAIDCQCGDGVAEDGEGGPAGVEEEGAEAGEAEGGVDEDAVVGLRVVSKCEPKCLSRRMEMHRPKFDRLATAS